jgi:CheY-like chemotaxis protein
VEALADDPAKRSSKPATVLVVEDDPDIRTTIAGLLQQEGYVVVMAEHGRQAFDYLLQAPAPDCLVLDLWMPVMDGWSLVAEMLAGRLPGIPTLVVTAANAQFAYPVPPRYVLRKPFDPGRLLLLVEELAEKNAARSG